jgi:serine/threonine-protein kinase
MEHLAGETLTRRIRRVSYLAPAVALGLLRQCAMAMSAAHARGIVHRDLKPDNIFIVPDPAVAGERIKVLDFGIAKLLGEGDASHGGTVTGMILGTPGYMSPEQCRGAGKVDHRTDIYALGCVAFHMICGRPPFVADTPGDLIAAHLVSPPPAPSSLIGGVSPALDALILNCLAKDAAARVQTMQELVAAIDDVAAAAVAPRGFALGTQAAPDRSRDGRADADATVAARDASDVLAAATVGTGAARPVPATPTTLGSSAGESIGPPARSGRGGVIAVGVALAAAAAIVSVVMLRGGKHRTGAAAGAIDAAPPPVATTTDAAPAPPPTPDAAPIVTARPDAAPRPPDHTHLHHGSGTAAGSAAPHPGSATGSATSPPPHDAGSARHSGSGSGSGYDPYDVR